MIKKMGKLTAMLLALVMLFSLAACGEEEQVETPAATPAPQEDAQLTPVPEAEDAQEVPAEAENDDAFTYTSELYNLTVTMPGDWAEKCEIVEEGETISFISASNRYQKMGDIEFESGVLFSILIPEDSMKDEDGSYFFPNYEVIGQFNGADIIVLYPTDVQANLDDPEAAEEYKEMYQMLPDIVSAISFG